MPVTSRSRRHRHDQRFRRQRGAGHEHPANRAPGSPIGPYGDHPSGLVVTFNGEIYNWQSLALRWGLDLQPLETDSHLLTRAWALFGPAVLDDLDGMFALAVYDPRERTLSLARDRLGEKPVYWRLDGDRLAFASEVGALQEYAQLSIMGRAEMLAVESSLGCQTPFAGVQLLQPGHVLKFDVLSASTQLRCYWSLPDVANTATARYASARLDYGDAVDTFTSLLAEHVPARRPDGDFALLLSGGLDSALLAYLMKPSHCITVRYPGHDRLDESAIAARIAADVGAEHLVVEPTADQFRGAASDMSAALGFPMANSSTFSEYAAYAASAQRGLRVVVGGAGPDELLLGYARHALALFGADASLNGGLEAYGPLAHQLAGQAGLSPEQAYLRLVLRGPDRDAEVATLVAETFNAGDDIGQALTRIDLAVSWRSLMLTSDSLSSRFGLERRSPYLARELVEFAYVMPVTHKLPSPGRGKAILRDAAERLGVPQQICRTRDKIGFASPVPGWLDGPLYDWSGRLIERARPLAATGVLHTILDRGRTSGSPFQRHRMQALMTAIWLLHHHGELNAGRGGEGLRWADAS